ncbi:glycoside hydrolase family 5 protein [Sorangium sp. So ce542]|uniref:glycoside hydrolase family 5 protein n=1 Tax=Sorangium sp. So ce542 TaxID=3133316 RepID=UPI003F6020D8
MLVALGCSSESSTSGNAGGSGGGTDTSGAGTSGAGTSGAGTGGAGTGGAGGAGAGDAGTGGGGAGGTGGSGGSGGSATPVDAAAMVPDMGIGTNIGNTLENTTEWETGWGQPLITQAFINGMASHGIKTVRVPVAWDTYAVNGTIDAAKMARVKEVVGWIEAAGMYSIVNIHWDGGWIFNEANANKYKLTDDVKTKFASYWTQIATAFSDVGHKLILEGMNEEGNYWVNGVHDGGTPDYAALNEMNQLFVTTVREQGGYNASRALLISGFVTDIDRTCVSDFKVPTDPAGTGSLFLSIHYYTPYTFCGLDTVESWGSPKTTWGTDAEKAELKGLFDKLGAFSAERSIPIILGEFAVTLGENYPREPASRRLWMQSVVEAAQSRGIVPVLWDTGSEIKRTDGSFSPEWQAVMDAVDR